MHDDLHLEDIDATAQWRQTFGKSPAVMDYAVLDALPNADREKSPTYLREITQVIPNKSGRSKETLEWASARDSWNDGKIDWRWPSQRALNAQDAVFEKHRQNVMRNRAESIPTGNESVRNEELPLWKLAFGPDDVTYGNPNVRVKYMDAQSKYTGRCVIEWTTDWDDDGKPRRVREYRVTQGNRKPVIFRDNEIVRKEFNQTTGMWNVYLPYKDRS